MAKAATVADQAMVDMADNANKFGTDIGSIQNAYQGFAKQNYTMLDNLKPNGEEVTRTVGFQPKEELKELIDSCK